MANPNKSAGYKRKMLRLEEESVNTRTEADLTAAAFATKYADRKVTIKVTSFRIGPRVGTHGCTRQAYNFMVRVYEKVMA